ncbi:hypothetical protein cand_002560 [Cryptosporidium andersoni]|uniref:Uncharacterized protein n=1 Tax=Cryptosporidium andersoni TaxID=117008 RepID=A0A1J4MSN9_9CRYT|nr:hypothetical protein cand_002560 [Cryptosporidium andersoni]
MNDSKDTKDIFQNSNNSLRNFEVLKQGVAARINKAVNSSRSILEGAVKCTSNLPKSYRILSLIPGAVEAPIRESKYQDDVWISISRKYTKEGGSKDKDLFNMESEEDKLVDDDKYSDSPLGDNADDYFKDFVTEAKAAEFVAKFLDRMQSKKFSMNYENLSTHVYGQTQLDRQLAAYPLFVATIANATTEVADIKKDSSLYSTLGGSSMGDYHQNKQIFDRNPLVQLMQELDTDSIYESAPSWKSKILPSMGTKLEYPIPSEEKCLGIYGEDYNTSESIIYRQLKLLPSAGNMGVRFSDTHENAHMGYGAADDLSITDDSTSGVSYNLNRSNPSVVPTIKRKSKNSCAAPSTAVNNSKYLNQSIPIKFPWLLRKLPVIQQIKLKSLNSSDDPSISMDPLQSDNSKKSFHQKLREMNAESNARKESVIKVITSIRGIAMVKNIAMVPPEGSVASYFEEMEENSPDDESGTWDFDRRSRNNDCKDAAVQKFMEESADEIEGAIGDKFDQMMKALENKHQELLETAHKSQGSSISSMEVENSSKNNHTEIFPTKSMETSNINTFGSTTIHTEELRNSSNVGENKLDLLNSNRNSGLLEKSVIIDYDLSEIFEQKNKLYKGEGIKKTWRSYNEALQKSKNAEKERKDKLESICKNLYKTALTGPQRRYSHIPRTLLPIHEDLQQFDDPQEEYLHFIQAQRMIAESNIRFPILSNSKVNKRFQLMREKNLIDNNSTGPMRGLGAIRGGRKIYQRFYNQERSETEKKLRSQKVNASYLDYNEDDRAEFIRYIKNLNKKVRYIKSKEEDLNVGVRIALRGRRIYNKRI